MATVRELEREQKRLYKKYCVLKKQLENVNAGSSGYKYIVNNFTELTQQGTPIANDFAYVKNSQGTAWLPGNLGGSYYSSGVYFYDGTEWINDNSQIAAQLQINIEDIVDIETSVNALSTQITDHITDLNNPHQTSGTGGGGDIITDVRTEDTVDFYYRGYNRNAVWEIERYPEDDINNFLVANQVSNPSQANLGVAWFNRAVLIYS